jgi:hypothetical protein
MDYFISLKTKKGQASIIMTQMELETKWRGSPECKGKEMVSVLMYGYRLESIHQLNAS